MQEGCTVNATLTYLGKKWTLLVLLELYKGTEYTRRFSELKDALPGITSKVLSARLKELEEEGLIWKQVEASTFPVKSEYGLTESGVEIIDVIREIKRWALKWKIDNIACGSQDCRDCVL
ncbi:transcriptional regulator [Methanofollis formosanus]|uniref:Transcriptional regulator n=1 Tax=Methanofollis formosanus TaxID=299308 RepID=A0A8G1EGZ7_9EURY|nr:helix-turn-helix domain-containing protein [Methanofollis formosanus]QYZ80353.1 transcriptional regulator [Methanofollis formosanus]